MRLVRRALKVVLAFLLVTVIVSGALLAWVTARALPQGDGSFKLAGLHAPVTVTRDVNGIAQIVAEDPHDLLMAQGYVHAQERFWQMEVWRHIGAGRLSELFGKSTLDKDRFIRTLGWRQAGQRDLDAASPATRAGLEAYAAGVNRWIDGHRGSLGLPFVLEGLMFGRGGGIGGYDPEPWTPLDSATWSKVQAWNLGDNLDREIFRLRADATLGDPALTDQLFPAYPSDGPIEVPTAAGDGAEPASTTASTTPDATPIAPQRAIGRDAAIDRNGAAGWGRLGALAGSLLDVAGLNGSAGASVDDGIGSNNWVVAPWKSATGHALLANDPHLGLDMPSVWFMNGLHCRTVGPACPFDVVGVSFPGVPSVILGHNARIAWGATNVGPDVEDLFEEKVDPADASHYLFRGSSQAFTVRHETIHVANGPDVELDVRSTGHGPVISDVDDDLKATGAVYSLRWTATAESDRLLDSFFAIDTARNWDDFRAALAVYGAPSQNFVYADVDGHIGLQVPGRMPIRADKRDLGDRPVPGWDGLHEWVGYVPYDRLPRLFDPPAGRIVTANAAPVDTSFAAFLGREWDPGYRARRIAELLDAAGTGGVMPDAMRAIQADTRVLRAPLVVAHLADAAPRTADGTEVLRRIRGWDSTCGVESEGCAAYMAFEYRLLRGLFDDELGNDLARDYVGSPPSWQALIAILGDPASPWWDDRTTTNRTETMADIVGAALDSAGAGLRAELGDPGGWTWGRLHTITFQEATLGAGGIGPIDWYLNSGPFPVAGAAGAVDNTYYEFKSAYYDPEDPTYRPGGLLAAFDVTNGPSYRLVVDMGDLDGAGIVITTGQSGNPFDRHYSDLIDDWLACRQVGLPFSPAAVEKSAVSTLTLTP